MYEQGCTCIGCASRENRKWWDIRAPTRCAKQTNNFNNGFVYLGAAADGSTWMPLFTSTGLDLATPALFSLPAIKTNEPRLKPMPTLIWNTALDFFLFKTP